MTLCVFVPRAYWSLTEELQKVCDGVKIPLFQQHIFLLANLVLQLLNNSHHPTDSQTLLHGLASRLLWICVTEHSKRTVSSDDKPLTSSVYWIHISQNHFEMELKFKFGLKWRTFAWALLSESGFERSLKEFSDFQAVVSNLVILVELPWVFLSHSV